FPSTTLFRSDTGANDAGGHPCHVVEAEDRPPHGLHGVVHDQADTVAGMAESPELGFSILDVRQSGEPSGQGDTRDGASGGGGGGGYTGDGPGYELGGPAQRPARPTPSALEIRGDRLGRLAGVLSGLLEILVHPG